MMTGNSKQNQSFFSIAKSRRDSMKYNPNVIQLKNVWIQRISSRLSMCVNWTNKSYSKHFYSQVIAFCFQMNFDLKWTFQSKYFSFILFFRWNAHSSVSLWKWKQTHSDDSKFDVFIYINDIERYWVKSKNEPKWQCIIISVIISKYLCFNFS